MEVGYCWLLTGDTIILTFLGVGVGVEVATGKKNFLRVGTGVKVGVAVGIRRRFKGRLVGVSVAAGVLEGIGVDEGVWAEVVVGTTGGRTT